MSAKKIFILFGLIWILSVIAFISSIVFFMLHPTEAGIYQVSELGSTIAMSTLIGSFCIGSVAFLVSLSAGILIRSRRSKLHLASEKKPRHTILVFSLIGIITLATVIGAHASELAKVAGWNNVDSPKLPSVSPSPNYHLIKEQLFQLVNQERKSRGLNTLIESQTLDHTAELKAQDMIAKNYWAHNTPDGKEPWIFYKEAGYNFSWAGENLSRNFYDAQTIFKSWMESQTHKDNILNPNYTEMGIYMTTGITDGESSFLVVQHFGTPQNVKQTGTANKQTPTNQKNDTPSRTGNIISYHEYCSGKDISIYENELITQASPIDGKTYSMTAGDWSCYLKNQSFTSNQPSNQTSQFAQQVIKDSANNSKYMACVTNAKTTVDSCSQACNGPFDYGRAACQAALNGLGWTLDRYQECLNENHAEWAQCSDKCTQDYVSTSNKCASDAGI
jgi:uncharacterized protein YkwD